MSTYEAMVDAEGRIVIPAELRRLMGMPTGSWVLITPQDHELRISHLGEQDAPSPGVGPAARAAVLRVQGSIPATRPMSEDFDDEIETATRAAMAEKYPWTVRR